jgi:DHA1 family tetracycline resistance protein-like MFS transporter
VPEQRTSRTPLIILFLTVFIDLLGFGIVIPFLPLYAERLGVGAAGIGLVLAIYSLMQFFFAPLLGRISDHVGRRPIIMLGLFGSSVGYLIYGFAFSFALLLISRAVHGMCAGTVSTAQAYVADTMPESKRAHGMGMIGAAFGLGFVLGPALGGLLGHASLRVPVFFAAALTFANLIFAALALPESHTPDPNARLGLKQMLEPLMMLPRQLTRHRLSRLFTVAFLLTFAISALEATFAMMVPAVYGYRALGVGVLLAYAGIVQALTQGYLIRKLVNRTGEIKLIRLGALLLGVGMIPLASSSSHVMLFILLAMVSLGYGFGSPSVASLISRRSERHQQGEVLGVNQSALSLARITGPIAAGFVYELIGPAAAYIGGGIVAIVALALTVTFEPVHARESGRSTGAMRL